MMNRRSLLTGLGSLFIAAPAIVRAQSIMPVRLMTMDTQLHRAIKAWAVGMQYQVGDIIDIYSHLHVCTRAGECSAGLPTRPLLDIWPAT